MSHDTVNSDFDYMQPVCQPHNGLRRCSGSGWRLQGARTRYFLNVPAESLVTQRDCAVGSIRGLLCIFVLFAAGCGSGEQSDIENDVTDAAELQARVDERIKGLATNFPPDTPESLRRKQEQAGEKFGQANEATARGDHDEAIQLFLEALYLEPTHRAARLQLAITLQTRCNELIPTDLWLAGKDIRNAGYNLKRLRKDYQDFSKDELRIMSEIFFDEARDYGRGTNLEEEFLEALGNAMSTGYSDLERLKTEPDIARFRTNPQTSEAIESAIESLQAAETEEPGAELVDEESGSE